MEKNESWLCALTENVLCMQIKASREITGKNDDKEEQKMIIDFINRLPERLKELSNRDELIINVLEKQGINTIWTEKKKQEHFYCIYLDHHKRIIKDKLLFIGTLNQTLVHPREVFKEACLLSASSIICVHNHPSGQVLPSREDYELTKRLVTIGHIMGIPINDHVIIGKSQYYSFFEHNDI